MEGRRAEAAAVAAPSSEAGSSAADAAPPSATGSRAAVAVPPPEAARRLDDYAEEDSWNENDETLGASLTIVQVVVGHRCESWFLRNFLKSTPAGLVILHWAKAAPRAPGCAATVRQERVALIDEVLTGDCPFNVQYSDQGYGALL